MNPMVRDLYKRFIVAGHHYPQGLDHVRERVKKGFFERKDIVDEIELKKAIAFGRYWVREVVAISKLHKYRALNKRYGKIDD
jgi:hypothetical protein